MSFPKTLNPNYGEGHGVRAAEVGVRIRGTLGDIDLLNTVPFKRATSRVQKGPLQGVSLILPRIRPCTSFERASTSCMLASIRLIHVKSPEACVWCFTKSGRKTLLRVYKRDVCSRYVCVCVCPGIGYQFV